jgi:hypothetical protein
MLEVVSLDPRREGYFRHQQRTGSIAEIHSKVDDDDDADGGAGPEDVDPAVALALALASVAVS